MSTPCRACDDLTGPGEVVAAQEGAFQPIHLVRP